MEVAFLLQVLLGVGLLVMYVSQVVNTYRIKKLLKYRFYHERLTQYKALVQLQDPGLYDKAHLYLLEAVNYKLRMARKDERFGVLIELKNLHAADFDAIGFAFPEYKV